MNPGESGTAELPRQDTGTQRAQGGALHSVSPSFAQVRAMCLSALPGADPGLLPRKKSISN